MYSYDENTILTNVIFANATIKGTNFNNTVQNGFTESQLYSTKSYQDKNLTGVKFGSNDLSGWKFNDQNLSSAYFAGAILTNSNFSNAKLSSASFDFTTLTNADFTNAIINGTDFTGTVSRGFTESQLYSTKSYQNKDLTGIILIFNDLSDWNFDGQNLQNSYFARTVLDNTDFSGADLRGASFDRKLDGSPIYKNTIMTDGVIKNFSMTSAADNFAVRKYQTPARATAISAKISDDNAKISGGAVLSLERGADLIVTNAKTLTVASDGAMSIDTDLSGSTKFTADHGAGLVFEDGAKLTINVMEDIVGGDALEFTALSWYDDSYIAGLDTIKPNQTLFLNVNGTAYAGDWTYEIKGNSLNISINVPEPSTYAAILGAIALGLAACRRRK